MIARHLPALAVALPLGAAAVLVAARERLPRRALDAITILVAAAVAAAAVALALDPREAAPYWFGAWGPSAGPPLGIAFAPDPAGAAFAAFAAVLVVISAAFAAAMFEAEKGLFHVLVLLFLGGMVGFSLTADLFDLFVFFELMGVAAFALTGWRADERGPLQAMMTFAVTNTVGAILFLFGTALLYGRTGALNLAAIGRALGGGRPDALVIAAFTALAAGLLVKLAAFPFHFWLADAHAVAPTPVCALFSGVMVPLGALGLVRVYGAIFPDVLPATMLRPALAAFAALTALVGSLMALVEHHLKRLLAFTTVSHAGVLLAGVATLRPDGLAAAALHAFGHGFLKAALFLCAGALLDRFGTIDTRRLHGRGKAVPEIAAVWALAVLGLVDLGPAPTGPPAFLLEEAARAVGLGWMGTATAAATVLSGAALLRVGAQVFLGAGSPDPSDPEQGVQDVEKREESERAGRLQAFAVPGIALALGLALRFVPGLVEGAHRAAAALLDHPGWAGWMLDGARAPWPAVEVLRVPLSTGALRAGIAVAGAALLLGRGRIAFVARFGVRSVHAVARPIERLHTGYLGDAVAWIGVGASLLAAWLAWRGAIGG